MKRFFLFSALTILIPLCEIGHVLPASATIGEPDTYHWTLEELIGALDGTNTEIWSSPYCQDQDMGEDPMMGGMPQNPCMQAVQEFANRDIIITAINPSKSTIKLFFRDSAYGGELATYANLYLFWHESPSATLDVLYGGISPEGTYDFLRINNTDLSTGILQPNREIELTITENQELLGVPSYQILYALRENDYAVNTAGFAEYQSCFEEGSGYQYGMECQVRFDDYLNTIYVPVATETAPISTEDQPNGEDTITSDAPNNVTTTMSIADEGYGGMGTNKSVDTISAPETGANTKLQDTDASEFPWWLGLIFGFGILTLAWLFWPKRAKKN